jgi:hypothetical protein
LNYEGAAGDFQFEAGTDADIGRYPIHSAQRLEQATTLVDWLSAGFGENIAGIVEIGQAVGGAGGPLRIGAVGLGDAEGGEFVAGRATTGTFAAASSPAAAAAATAATASTTATAGIFAGGAIGRASQVGNVDGGTQIGGHDGDSSR